MEQNELALRLTELAVDYPSDEWLGLPPEERVEHLVSIYETFRRHLGGVQKGQRPGDLPMILAENLNPDDIEAA